MTLPKNWITTLIGISGFIGTWIPPIVEWMKKNQDVHIGVAQFIGLILLLAGLAQRDATTTPTGSKPS